MKNLFRPIHEESGYGRFLHFLRRRRVRGSDARPHLGPGPRMTLAQILLLVISGVMFVYLGYAMFKPEKF